MTLQPLKVYLGDGTSTEVHPSRTLAAVAAGKDSIVWHLDAEGLIEKIHMHAEIEHVREALGLENKD